MAKLRQFVDSKLLRDKDIGKPPVTGFKKPEIVLFHLKPMEARMFDII